MSNNEIHDAAKADHVTSRACSREDLEIMGKYNEELVKAPESIAKMEQDFKASRGETEG
jgi:hypothetical protein